MIAVTGCQSKPADTSKEEMTSSETINFEVTTDDSWNKILEDAKGTTVTFYGWGGSQMTNEWLDNTVADYLLENYDITLERVPMNIDEILNKLLGEKQLNAEGTVDVVWINGENFSTAKSNDLLYGPFVGQLPNFNQYVDANALESNFDFGFS
ncbi:MAG: extracellular solute-binding protein, partial [Clostridia bacterium]|nr:extracellular solute-binding protein [Clostridia bacterium]